MIGWTPCRTGRASVTADLPAEVDGDGDGDSDGDGDGDGDGSGYLVGTVTLTSIESPVVGVATPEADVFVASAGRVVSTPSPKDLIGRRVDLGIGASQDFIARCTPRHCATGRPLTAGHYELFAIVVVNSDNAATVFAEEIRLHFSA